MCVCVCACQAGRVSVRVTFNCFFVHHWDFLLIFYFFYKSFVRLFVFCFVLFVFFNQNMDSLEDYSPTQGLPATKKRARL